MTRFPASTPSRVRASDCMCPGAPHAEGDFVYLFERMPVEAGTAATRALANVSGGEDPTNAVLWAMLPYVIARWDFLDHETSEPIPINPDTVREALPWTHGGYEVADAAAKRYLDTVTVPFLSALSRKRNGKSSPSTPTASTSPKTSSSSSRRKRSE